MTDITPSNKETWMQTITSFKDKAKEFQILFDEISNARIPDWLKTQYNDIITRGNKIRLTVVKTTDAVNMAWNYIKNFFGFDGFSEAETIANNNGLGALPLIPIAVIAGAVTLMSKWIKDAVVLATKLREIKKLQIEEGLSFDQASKRIQSLTKPAPLFGIDMSKLIPVVGVGALFWFFMRKR